MTADHAGSFDYEIVPRSKIKGAPYNPRHITNMARGRLQHGMEQFGLVQPLIWNRRTNHLVAGHQRLDLLDEEHAANPNYNVPCAVVDLPLAKEKSLNILLNNPEAMGGFDISGLSQLLNSGEFDVTDAGFDASDVHRLYGDHPEAPKPPRSAVPDARTDPGAAQNAIAEIEARKKAEEKQNAMLSDWDEKYYIPHEKEGIDDDHYYLVVVFEKPRQRALFQRKHGLPPEQFFLDGRTWNNCVGVPPPDDGNQAAAESAGSDEAAPDAEDASASADDG